MLNSVSRRPTKVGEVVHERDGSVIPDQARRLCRWEEHIKEPLYNATPPNTAEERLSCKVYQPSLEEVCTAARQPRSNTVQFKDGIPADV